MSVFRSKNAVSDIPNYLKRVEAILAHPLHGEEVQLDYRWQTPEEARAQTERIQTSRRELKKLKQAISQDIRDLHAAFTAQRGAVSAGPLGLVAGNKRSAKIIAGRREKLRLKEEAALDRLQSACKVVDTALRQLDEFEGRIGAWLNTHH